MRDERAGAGDVGPQSPGVRGKAGAAASRRRAR